MGGKSATWRYRNKECQCLKISVRKDTFTAQSMFPFFFQHRLIHNDVLKFSVDEAGPSRPSTPNVRTKISSDSRPSTPTGRPSTTHTHALHPKQPVQTPQQFYDWFALIDRSVAHSQESHFRAHVASVAEHLDTCDRLVEKIDEIDGEVEGMLEGWKGVEEGGRSLQDACERLLEERVWLISVYLLTGP